MFVISTNNNNIIVSGNVVKGIFVIEKVHVNFSPVFLSVLSKFLPENITD